MSVRTAFCASIRRLDRELERGAWLGDERADAGGLTRPDPLIELSCTWLSEVGGESDGINRIKKNGEKVIQSKRST